MKKVLDFFKNHISNGSFENFKINTALIGAELAFNLNLEVGDKINLMSSSFITTPFGNYPKQESFKISGIFRTGFYQFDKNFVFLNMPDILSIFDKVKGDQNIEIYISNPMDADIYKNQIQQEMNKNYFVYSWTDLNKSFF